MCGRSGADAEPHPNSPAQLITVAWYIYKLLLVGIHLKRGTWPWCGAATPACDAVGARNPRVGCLPAVITRKQTSRFISMRSLALEAFPRFSRYALKIMVLVFSGWKMRCSLPIFVSPARPRLLIVFFGFFLLSFFWEHTNYVRSQKIHHSLKAGVHSTLMKWTQSQSILFSEPEIETKYKTQKIFKEKMLSACQEKAAYRRTSLKISFYFHHYKLISVFNGNAMSCQASKILQCNKLHNLLAFINPISSALHVISFFIY